MSWKDVVIDEEGGEFFKFDAIGTKLSGVFLSKAMDSSGKYGPKMAYNFRTAAGEVKVNPPVLLERAFESVNDGAGLAAGDGVIATYVKDIPPTKAGNNPTKGFTMKFECAADGNARRKAAAKAGASAPKPPPPPPPADELEDIPL